MSCLAEYCARIQSCLEGNYTTWTVIGTPISVGNESPSYIFFSEPYLMIQNACSLQLVNLNNFESSTISGVLHSTNGFNSVFGTYVLIPTGEGVCAVYKNGVFLFNLNMPDDYADIWTTSISLDGQYVCMTVKDNSNNYWLIIFQGS